MAEISQNCTNISLSTSGSAPSERMFSLAKGIQTDKRNFLNPEHLNQLVFLKYNFMKVHPKKIELVAMIDKQLKEGNDKKKVEAKKVNEVIEEWDVAEVEDDDEILEFY